jgi:hypothetical protein
MQSGKHGSVTGACRRQRYYDIVEDQAASSKRIDVWGSVMRMPVRSQMIGAERVDRDQ